MNAQVEPSLLLRYRLLNEIVCCPQTRTPLRLVGRDELLVDLPATDRERLPAQTRGAFISDATRRAFPFSERIVSFLDHDSLTTVGDLPGTRSTRDSRAAEDEVQRSVREWYDQFGWKKNESGAYNDTAVFSQSTGEGHGLYELNSHLSILGRLRGGQFVLDAASGAIPHQEYLAFSWFYKSRICVDMSITALEEAAMKVREGDFCCLADICQLPFRDKVFDGAISGYTIQHIPESKQAMAVKELYRVLRPAAHLCIFTDVSSRSHARFYLVVRALTRALSAIHLYQPKQPPPASSAVTAAPTGPLYFHARSLKWWRDLAAELGASASIETLRIFTKSEFERLFGFSNRAAVALQAFQNLFPRLTARLSHYCLVDLGRGGQ